MNTDVTMTGTISGAFMCLIVRKHIPTWRAARRSDKKQTTNEQKKGEAPRLGGYPIHKTTKNETKQQIRPP